MSRLGIFVAASILIMAVVRVGGVPPNRSIITRIESQDNDSEIENTKIADSNEIPKPDSYGTTTYVQINTADHNGTDQTSTISTTTAIDSTTDYNRTQNGPSTKSNFRKRRGANSIAERKQISSSERSSEEIEGSGENDIQAVTSAMIVDAADYYDTEQAASTTTPIHTTATAYYTSEAVPSNQLNFRKRRGVNSIAEAKRLSSSAEEKSEETEGSGENDITTGRSKDSLSNTESSEDAFNGQNTKDNKIDEATSAESSGEGEVEEIYENGSASNGSISDSADNDTFSEQRVSELKTKIRNWQKTVDNYLNGQRQRSKRQQQVQQLQQSPWSQLFPPSALSNTQGSSTIGKGSNSVMSIAGEAMSGALKPAMNLMTQGVDLLTDLYSAQLSRSASDNAIIAANANATTVEQFRGQMRQLQRKFGDLSEQLQRVVNSFQEMQLPFLDNIVPPAAAAFPQAPSINSPSLNNAVTQPKNNAVLGETNINKKKP